MSPAEATLDRRPRDGDLGPTRYAGSRIACHPDFRPYKRRLRPTRPSSRSRCHAAATQRSVTRSTHMCQQLIPDETVRAALGSPATSSLELKAISSPRLQRMFKVRLTGDRRDMVLVMAPSSVLRLLRSERLLTLSESTVVRWLTERASPSGRPDDGDTSSRPPEQIPDAALLSYLPRLVAGAPLATGAAAPFNIFDPPPGLPISALDIPLTTRERVSVDYQAGVLVRRISQLVPANGKFGPAVAVLAPSLGHRVAVGVEAAGTWSVAFHSLLESALRDGEDMTVVLAYSAIRSHFRRLGHVLDGISTPRLVIVDAVDDTNLLVSRSHRPELPLSHDTPQIPAALDESGNDRDDKKEDTDNPRTPPPTTPDEPTIAVTGLRDWGCCIFGDTLFAAAFCEQPSESLLRGFSHNVVEHVGADRGPDGGLDEDREPAQIRLLLYQCYHNVVRIVKEFYRPTGDSSKRELEARKRLHGVLAKLDQVEDWPRRRHRRPSGEVSPAKKPRSGDSSGGLGGAGGHARGDAGEGSQRIARQSRPAVDERDDTEADYKDISGSLGSKGEHDDGKEERAKK